MSMAIIPALDLRAGRVVRLRQGDYARETGYDVDAVAQARSYAAAGARWLHVVDLDGARDGRLDNLRSIEALAALAIDVQAGGGVRSADDVERLFDAGAKRVVVGSVAVADPARVSGWISRFGAQRIVIALDARYAGGAWRLATAGWTTPAVTTLDELAPRYAAMGAQHLLCTDIARDGMLCGPNLTLYAHLARLAPSLALQASGGVRGLDDIHALQQCGVAGAILGRSLLEGCLDLARACAC